MNEYNYIVLKLMAHKAMNWFHILHKLSCKCLNIHVDSAYNKLI